MTEVPRRFEINFGRKYTYQKGDKHMAMDLKNQLSVELGCSKVQAEKILHVLFGSRDTAGLIEQSVTVDGRVLINGFGVFTKKERAAREGRNPSTNQPLQIPAKVGVGFSAARNFKERINKK